MVARRAAHAQAQPSPEAAGADRLDPLPSRFYGRAFPLAHWRSVVLDRAEWVRQEAQRCRERAVARPADWRNLVDSLTEVLEVACPARQGWARRLTRPAREIARTWSGADVERAWAALHRAEESLILLQPDDTVRAAILTAPTGYADSGARRDTAGRAAKTGAVTEAEREWLRARRHLADAASEASQGRVRTFRNVLIGLGILLTVGLLIAAFWGYRDRSALPLCPATENSSTCGARTDVLRVEFFGALGGALSIVTALRVLNGFRGSYGLPLAQALLKLPLGAAAALTGIVIVQQEGLGPLHPQPISQLVPLAFIFGVGQVAVTKNIDNRASDLLGEAAATGSQRTRRPAERPESSHARSS